MKGYHNRKDNQAELKRQRARIDRPFYLNQFRWYWAILTMDKFNSSLASSLAVPGV